MKVNRFQRGQIWWYETNVTYDGNVQGKTRPVIIISNDKANENSNNVTVVPCTTKVKNMYLPTHLQFKLNDITNVALCENILTVTKNKLRDFEGICDSDLLNKLDECIKIALGLVPVNQKSYDDAIAEEDNKPAETIENNADNEDSNKQPLIITPTKGARKKYTLDEMQRYVKDYENHRIDYMIKKYNECSAKAVSGKVYRFRKIIIKGE